MHGAITPLTSSQERVRLQARDLRQALLPVRPSLRHIDLQVVHYELNSLNGTVTYKLDELLLERVLLRKGIPHRFGVVCKLKEGETGTGLRESIKGARDREAELQKDSGKSNERLHRDESTRPGE